MRSLAGSGADSGAVLPLVADDTHPRQVQTDDKDKGWVSSSTQGPDRVKIADPDAMSPIAEVIPSKRRQHIATCQAEGRQVVPLWRVEDGVLIGTGAAAPFTSGRLPNFQYRVEVMINDHETSGSTSAPSSNPAFPRGTSPNQRQAHCPPPGTCGTLLPAIKKVLVENNARKPDEWVTQEVTPGDPS